MSDASSVRYAASLPAATGRMASSIRYSAGQLWFSDGTAWLPLATKESLKNSITYVPTTAATEAFFIADRAYTVNAISEVHGTAESTTTNLTVQVTKDSGTTAAGAGTSLLSSAFTATTAAATVQNGSLVTTTGVTTLAAGDRLSAKFSGSVTELAGLVVTVVLTAVSDPKEIISVKLAATAASAQTFFIADRAYQIVSIKEIHPAAGGTSTTATGAVYKETGTQAAGGGVTAMNGTFDLKGTASTVQSATLTATPANSVLAAGNRLSFVVAKTGGTLDTYTGSTVSVVLQAI